MFKNTSLVSFESNACFWLSILSVIIFWQICSRAQFWWLQELIDQNPDTRNDVKSQMVPIEEISTNMQKSSDRQWRRKFLNAFWFDFSHPKMQKNKFVLSSLKDSMISQQTAKMFFFLWQGRSYYEKVLSLILRCWLSLFGVKNASWKCIWTRSKWVQWVFT
jgi:hypothetical protein